MLSEKKFLAAQDLFFSTLTTLGGTVDFDIADMREVHAVAALGDVQGLRVLDIGCGSCEPYVLTGSFRDRYPPFFAEMLAARGAKVTGVDIRPNPRAGYDHRVLDCTAGDWAASLQPPYDIVACLSLFNAPGSPFEHDTELCDHLMSEMHSLVGADGIVIVTLRDDFFDPSCTKEAQEQRVSSYASSEDFLVTHLDGNCAWLRHR